ncbi:hypothetical protein CVT25_011722 [Psilocybe cyanescens]|uniref:NAD-dependent epimerase/dehydratase domain-containing protein n=1 Tax=Psilocybe cyanescens TaxID=93625 RepID=A0A409WID0_PSICY|nr:hypothetical protein CVT25_011722 [Psilocybe cyanescens]
MYSTTKGEMHIRPGIFDKIPAIAKGSKVLVSGANGFLAIWTTQLLLERGYSVRGTVRSENKSKYLKDYFASIGYKDKLEVVFVEDISKDGAFDEAVQNVDAILHIASPIAAVISPDEMIRPAIEGTTGILKSALKTGNKVKRIVVTSSTSAVMPPVIDKPTVLSELDWDTHFPRRKARKLTNKQFIAPLRRAWDYYNTHKLQTQWDITTLTPSWPPIHEVKSASSLNYSLAVWYNTVIENKTSTKEFLSASQAWVDVRDLALAHILALENPEAGGERILVTGVDAANSLSPTLLPSHNPLPVGYPEMTKEQRTYNLLFDTSKQKRLLDIRFRSLEETTKDIFECISERGW